MTDLLPRILHEERDGSRVVLTLHVVPTLAYFAGHFPGAPVLPGVIHIDWAFRLARRCFSWPGEFVGLEQVKFNRPLVPNMDVELELTYDEARGRLDYCYRASQTRHSSGRIILSVPA